MTLQAADIDNIRFATLDGYSEAEVDEFAANVRISRAAAEAAPGPSLYTDGRGRGRSSRGQQ